MNHLFVYNVLTRDFKSNDLGITARNLRNERNPEKRINILNHMDRADVTQRMMSILEIRNKEEQQIGITSSHITLIKQYLKALDLIVDCPIEYGQLGIEKEERVLFSQPGMRYCQAQALAYAVMKDNKFSLLTDEIKNDIVERILEEVRGRMLEDIERVKHSMKENSEIKVNSSKLARQLNCDRRSVSRYIDITRSVKETTQREYPKKTDGFEHINLTSYRRKMVKPYSPPSD